MVKLDKKWDNDTYIGSAIVFGCVHEAVSSIPTGIKMFTYIHDCILILPKATADQHFALWHPPWQN